MSELVRQIENKDAKIKLPSSPRRLFLASTAGLALASALRPTDVAYASPLEKPKDPNNAPKPPTFIPEIAAETEEIFGNNIDFYGKIGLSYLLTFETGYLNWKVNQKQLSGLMDYLDQFPDPKSSSLTINDPELTIQLALYRVTPEQRFINFLIKTKKYSLYGDTKPISPTKLADLDYFEATWQASQPVTAMYLDKNGNDLELTNRYELR